MTGLDIRVGDVVRLLDFKVTAIEQRMIAGDYVGGGRGYVYPLEHVVEIISRAETDAEKIARLEAENAELRRDLQASEQEPDILINARGVCPCEPDRKVVVWLRSGEKVSQDAGCFRWKLDLEKKDDDVFAYMVLPS